MSKPSYDPVNKIWSGPKIPPIYNPDQNLGQLILKVLQYSPEAIAQVSTDTGASVTCCQMYDRSVKIAKYLISCGMKEGDTIGVVAGNSENLAPVVYASFALGLPINPLSPVMNEKEIVRMYSMTKPKIIFCDAENIKIVQNAVNVMNSNAKILTIMDVVDGYECETDIIKSMQDENVDFDFEFPFIDSNATAVILCSSGSTGLPKGVAKSHKHVISNLDPLWTSSSTPSVFLHTSGIFWLSGFYCIIASVLFRSKRVCSAKSLDLQQLVDTINKHKVSVVILSQLTLVSLLQLENFQPLTSIRTLILGGAVISEQICQKFKSFIPNGKFMVGYGCTEQSFLARDFKYVRNGSCGHPYFNVELKIIDEAGNSLGPNTSGEICSKLPVQFSGYIGQPEATAKEFDGDWFKTGDIGYFDDNCNIYIVDRKKEMLKCKGYQVTPSEIEEIINEIEGVSSSCVVGVPEANSGFDILHAFVILEESNNLTENSIIEHVNSKVIDAKQIRGGVHFVTSFPLGMTGKVDRNKVKAMAKEMNL